LVTVIDFVCACDQHPTAEHDVLRGCNKSLVSLR
jgi:hypothetical protein